MQLGILRLPCIFYMRMIFFLFGRGTKSNLHKVVEIFNIYVDMADQQVNWNKSFIYFGTSLSIARQVQLVQEVGMLHGSLLSIYLVFLLLRKNL